MSISQLFTEALAMSALTSVQKGSQFANITTSDTNGVFQASDGAGGLVDTSIFDAGNGIFFVASDLLQILPFAGGQPTNVINGNNGLTIYRSIQSAAPGLAQFVGTPLSRQGLTAPLSAVALLSAAPIGAYRIDGYLVVTTPATSGTISVNAVINDETGARTVVIATSTDVGASVALPFHAVVRNDGGTNDAKISTSFNTVIGVPHYSIYATIEPTMIS